MVEVLVDEVGTAVEVGGLVVEVGVEEETGGEETEPPPIVVVRDPDST